MPLTYGALELLSGLGSMSPFGSRDITKFFLIFSQHAAFKTPFFSRIITEKLIQTLLNFQIAVWVKINPV